ncbi:MAG: hypothetical protein GKR91_03475 [Pseudomonadales bacterium]|nr:hypothetical protein [Pseudomonadales bacterium]
MIKVSVTVPLANSPDTIFTEILKTSNWESFKGFGPLPGIRQAQFSERTEAIVGSRIEVQNLDGSSHVETITKWQPYTYIEMSLEEFSPPLSRMASHFTEQWFVSDGEVTRVMSMYPKSALAVPLLWIISLFMKRALATHTREICNV